MIGHSPSSHDEASRDRGDRVGSGRNPTSCSSVARKYGILFLRRICLLHCSRLADLRGVLLGEPARLVEQVAPLLRRHAGGFEDVERAGDGRGQGRLITELAGEVFEERRGAAPGPRCFRAGRRSPRSCRSSGAGGR